MEVTHVDTSEIIYCNQSSGSEELRLVLSVFPCLYKSFPFCLKTLLLVLAPTWFWIVTSHNFLKEREVGSGENQHTQTKTACKMDDVWMGNNFGMYSCPHGQPWWISAMYLTVTTCIVRTLLLTLEPGNIVPNPIYTDS
jgi:hypothetical protein